MLLSASDYQSLQTEELRQFLASGLHELFFMHQHSNEEISFLPTKEELKAAGK